MSPDILGPFMAHGRCIPFISSVWQNEQTLTVKSSSTGYDLMRLGSILNGGYCVLVLNKPHIVPQEHDSIKTAIQNLIRQAYRWDLCACACVCAEYAECLALQLFWWGQGSQF